jgi:hypothetical protein
LLATFGYSLGDATMKFGVLADIHIGNHQGHKGGAYSLTMNDRCRRVLDAVKMAVEAAKAEGCEEVVIVGDLFDNEKATPQMIAATAEALGLTTNDGLPVRALLGNHDRVSAQTGDHALGWLGATTAGHVHAEPVALHHNSGDVHYIVPFDAGPSAAYLERALHKLRAEELQNVASYRYRILFVHMGICDEKTAVEQPWAASADDAIKLEKLFDLCCEYAISHVFAGNWHSAGQWECTHPDGSTTLVTQVGALVPTGWDNPGPSGYGGLDIFENGVVTRIEIPGPRFLTVNSQKELLALADDPNNFVRFVCLPNEVNEVSALCEEQKTAGKLGAWTITVDVAASKRAALVGARVAGDAHTLREALAGYVGALDIPTNINRGNVLARCAAALGMGAEAGAS